MKIDYRSWFDFACEDDQQMPGTRYNEPDRSTQGDFKAFVADLRVGHPEAVEMLTRYITWKLRS